MKNFGEKIKIAFKDPMLRKRIGFTVLALVGFRLLAAIPIPSVDPVNLANLLSSSQLFGFLNIGTSSMRIIYRKLFGEFYFRI